MKPRRLDLDFVARSGAPRSGRMLLIGLAVPAVFASFAYLDAMQTVNVLRAEMAARETIVATPPGSPRRGMEEAKALRQELDAANRQIRQLNQSWDGLLADLRSFPGDKIRMLGVDVDARGGTVRVAGVAADAATMADYAAYLAEKKSLRAVLLLRHEADAAGLRFVIDGRWSDKP